jgi:hypothetical protein
MQDLLREAYGVAPVGRAVAATRGTAASLSTADRDALVGD